MQNFKNNVPVMMRTISEAHKELLKLDPHTAITKYRIKTLVKNGVIPTVSAGKKKVCINFYTLLDYLAHPRNYPVPEEER